MSDRECCVTVERRMLDYPRLYPYFSAGSFQAGRKARSRRCNSARRWASAAGEIACSGPGGGPPQSGRPVGQSPSGARRSAPPTPARPAKSGRGTTPGPGSSRSRPPSRWTIPSSSRGVPGVLLVQFRLQRPQGQLAAGDLRGQFLGVHPHSRGLRRRGRRGAAWTAGGAGRARAGHGDSGAWPRNLAPRMARGRTPAGDATTGWPPGSGDADDGPGSRGGNSTGRRTTPTTANSSIVVDHGFSATVRPSFFAISSAFLPARASRQPTGASRQSRPSSLRALRASSQPSWPAFFEDRLGLFRGSPAFLKPSLRLLRGSTGFSTASAASSARSTGFSMTVSGFFTVSVGFSCTASRASSQLSPASSEFCLASSAALRRLRGDLRRSLGGLDTLLCSLRGLFGIFGRLLQFLFRRFLAASSRRSLPVCVGRSCRPFLLADGSARGVNWGSGGKGLTLPGMELRMAPSSQAMSRFR